MSLGWWTGRCPVPIVLFLLLLAAPVWGVSREIPESAEAPDSSSISSKPHGVRFDSGRFGRAYDEAAAVGKRSSGPVGAAVTAESTGGLGRLLGQITFSLIFVIGSIYGVIYLLNRYMGKSFLHSSGPLKVLARQPVSQKNTLYVVSALDRFLIIGESPRGLTCLAEFNDPEENRRLQEKWGWEWGAPGEKNRLFTEKNSPFGPTLQSHVSELERELDRIKEVS